MVDNSEWVDVEFDKLVRQSTKAFLVEVDGDEYWIAKSQVDNTDDLEEDLSRPIYKREESAITVPRWLAVQNGWLEEDD